MIVLAIWLFLAGYTIAITGKRNLGLSYQPQSDGSIKAVDQKGNPAKAFSLLDVVRCQDASVSVGGQPAPLGAAQSSRPAGTPPLNPNLVPNPRLAPQFLPAPALDVPVIRLPGWPPPVPPGPRPGGILGGLLDFERTVERDVYGGLHGLGGTLRGALGGIRLPQLPRPGGGVLA